MYNIASNFSIKFDSSFLIFSLIICIILLKRFAPFATESNYQCYIFFTSQDFTFSPTLFIIIIIISGVGLSPVGTAATFGLLYKPQMIDEGDCGGNWWNEDWQGKPKYSKKTCPSATLSTTNPT
jgi:hypothetical protein